MSLGGVVGIGASPLLGTSITEAGGFGLEGTAGLVGAGVGFVGSVVTPSAVGYLGGFLPTRGPLLGGVVGFGAPVLGPRVVLYPVKSMPFSRAKSSCVSRFTSACFQDPSGCLCNTFFLTGSVSEEALRIRNGEFLVYMVSYFL